MSHQSLVRFPASLTIVITIVVVHTRTPTTVGAAFCSRGTEVPGLTVIGTFTVFKQSSAFLLVTRNRALRNMRKKLQISLLKRSSITPALHLLVYANIEPRNSPPTSGSMNSQVKKRSSTVFTRIVVENPSPYAIVHKRVSRSFGLRISFRRQAWLPRATADDVHNSSLLGHDSLTSNRNASSPNADHFSRTGIRSPAESSYTRT